MRRALKAALLAALVGVPVGDLVFKSAKFDGQQVEVKGKAIEIQSRNSEGGKPYVLFRLLDEATKRWVKVFAWGSPVLYEGRSVTVLGTFHAEKQVGERTFKKEIDAAEIR